MNNELKAPRLVFLDNLKILFAILVVFQHTRVTYGMTGSWYYIESAPLDAFSIVFFYIVTSFGGMFQSSLLGLFFLMGGYFTPISYDRKGARSFWKERLLRLGVPLLLYIFIINPIIMYSLFFFGLYAHPLPSDIIGFLTYFGPMWFLVVLLLFTAVYTIYRQLTKSRVFQNQIHKKYSIPKYRYLLLLAICLGIITFFIRILSPIDQYPYGIPLANILQYILMFSVGIIAVRYNWVQKMTKYHVKIWLFTIVITILAFGLYFFLILGVNANFSVLLGGFTIPALLFAILDNILCMGMIFVLIKGFYAKFNKQGKILRNLAPSAFNIYLIHAPILVLVAVAFSSLPLIPVIKLAIVFPLTVLVCYLLSHFILEKIHLKNKKKDLFLAQNLEIDLTVNP
jgi:glucan biosynthesis protein C